MFSKKEWKRRIVTYIAYGGNHRIRCATKVFILERIGGSSDQNANQAFDELVNDKLIESVDGRFFIINLEKRGPLLEIINSEPEDKLTRSQPVHNILQGYTLRFAVRSNWKYSNQRAYYYYTKNDDIAFWVVITKKKGPSGNDKIILGSFDEDNSRYSRIWRATRQAARREPDGTFVRKWVEDLEPEACGNNRMPSGAAFRLFRHLNMIDLVRTKGKTEYYRLTGKEPTRENLDKFFEEVPEE